MAVSPKVSVILTSYNSEKYLHECIESVLNQTYQDFELIIWYDESTDDSWNIISSYTDQRIRVFKNESNRFVAHYQKAISDIAQGEYIAIHHSDDVWETDKLEKQVTFLDAHPEIGAVFSRVLIIGEDGKPFQDESHFYYKVFDQPNRNRHEWLNFFFYQGNALCHPSVLIRKICYADCGTYRYGIAHPNDLDLWVRLCQKYEIYVLPEKLVRFRVRSNEMNASGDRPAARILGVFGLFQMLNNYRSINTAEEFIKIFPSAKKYLKQDSFDISFALGMAALEPGTPVHTRLFGLQLLFDVLNDPGRARKIEELYGFRYKDFFTSVVENDVFSTELIPNLSAQLAQKERENQALLSQLHRQNLSVTKRTIGSLWERLRPFRLRIAPQGSRQENLLRMVYLGLRTWKREGLISAYRRSIQKISRGLSVRTDRIILPAKNSWAQKKQAGTSPLDLRAVREVESIPSTYDVIFLIGTDRRSRVQSPGPLAKHFARDGHRVFYAFFAFGRSAKTKVRLIDNNIFDVQLFRSESKMVGASSFSGQKRADICAVFDALRSELGIANAICLVESPLWAPPAFSLREKFNWKILYHPSREPSSVDQAYQQARDSLVQNSDLVLAPSGSQDTWEGSYTQIKQRVPTLFLKASIIIVTYNNLEYTRLCLQSIYEKTIYPNFEVIVIDNASFDATQEFLNSCESKYENFQVIYNAENEGFARANNLGIAAARGDCIVLLNNDTIVTRGWLSKLIHYLSDQQIGLVGTVTNGVSNEAQVEMPFTDIAALDTFARTLAKERSGTLTPIKMLAMYCIAGRRDVFQQIGPLDEQFGIGMFEDDDYSLRIRRAGYRIVVAEDVFIQHFGRSGFKLMGDEQYLALFEENRKKFETKWNIKWEQHVNGTLAENRRLAADLQDILNAYPAAPEVIIFPPTIGWNISLFQRPHQLARALAAKDCLVFFCTEASVDYVEGFRQVSQGLYLANVPWGVFDLVERPVIFTLPYNRQYLFQFRQPRIVYEVIDDLDVFPEDKAQLQKNHDILLKEADLVVVTADQLMEQVKQTRADAMLCPNAVELDHFSRARDTAQPSPTDLAEILRPGHTVIGYYGALARWFDYDLVRQTAQQHPNWDFVLIGPNHDNTLMASNILSLPNIHWLGARDYSQLPDYLRHFTVATIPFLVNDITRATSPIKLFEYMAAAKPIVTTDMPECRKYPGVLVARDTNEYIEHLEHALTLIHDAVYLEQGVQIALENTWEARVNQIMDALKNHPNPNLLHLEARY